jgi:hypothetical protein
MNRLLSLIGIVVLTLSFSASAKTDEDIRSDIQEMISRRAVTATAQWWQDQGASAPNVIMGMYKKSQRRLERLRLVEALSFYPESTEAVAFLKSEGTATKNSALRQAVIRSLSASQGIKEKDFFAGYLKHSDPNTRLEAALALKRTGDPQATEMVEGFAAKEKAAWVVKSLNKASAPRTTPETTSKVIAPNAHIVRDTSDRQ